MSSIGSDARFLMMPVIEPAFVIIRIAFSNSPVARMNSRAAALMHYMDHGDTDGYVMQRKRV